MFSETRQREGIRPRLTAHEVVQSQVWCMHTFVCSRLSARHSERCNYAVRQWIGVGHVVRFDVSGMTHHADDAVLPVDPESNGELPLKEACEQFERQYVLRVLDRRRWNISRAARVLRVHRNTILRKLSSWGLERPGGDTAARAAERPSLPLGVLAPHGKGQAHSQRPGIENDD